MLRRDDVYDHISSRYELLISKEDYEGNIARAIAGIVRMQGKDFVDLGAGTGRLTRLYAPIAASATAVDRAADMLRVAASKLAAAGLFNWRTIVSDYRRVPLDDRCADVVTAGWTLCYVASSDVPGWEEHLETAIGEIDRLLRDGGTSFILETLGTGEEEPRRPEHLRDYYDALERKYGYRHLAVRTDYAFDSAEQAESLCRDFFGDELGDRIREKGLRIVPENTGIWWRSKRVIR